MASAFLGVVGCRAKAPRIDFANRGYSAALRTATNTRNPQRLVRAKAAIEKDRDAGRIGPEEYACYAVIIGLAEAGQWEQAEKLAIQFRQDQR